MGLTATPFTSEIETGDDEDKLFVRDTLAFLRGQEADLPIHLRQAVDEGYLVPYQIYKAKTVKTAAADGFEVKKNRAGLVSHVAKGPARVGAAVRRRRHDQGRSQRAGTRFTIPERNRAIVREYRDVLANGYQDKKGVMRYPQFGKTIVFAVTKRHAETLAQMFDEAFAHEKPSPEVRYADFVVSGFGKGDTLDAATKIRRFKREEFPKILVSVNMLDTGFDAPEVVSLMMARFTRSSCSTGRCAAGTPKGPRQASLHHVRLRRGDRLPRRR